MKSILIIEDDEGLREGIALALGTAEYDFTLCGSLFEARNMFKERRFDLAILDINLPDGDGYDLLKEIRECSLCPVIILTANDLELDEVKGLTLGAEDYMTKPFSLMVLRARIGKVFGRKEKEEKKEYTFGSLYFDFSAMRFNGRNGEILLSRTEQRLLRLLVENEGIALSRESLTDHIWDGTAYVDENALSVTVNRLRSKLGESPSAPEYLHTVYGYGYIWKRGD